MLDQLQAMGLALFVVSNEARDRKVEELVGLPRDQFLYNSDCGTKGRKNYIRSVLKATGNSLNELVYLGDSELDMREAAGGNERVALFNAEWSNPGYAYGFSEGTPAEFANDLKTYFLKEKLWYMEVDGADALNRPVKFRSLLDPDKAKNEGVTRLLKERSDDFANNKQDLDLAVHLDMHLIASVYLEGIHLDRLPNSQGGFKKPLWCLYPGSSGGISPVLRLFERFTARLLTMTYYENLLVRHTAAPTSHKQRMANGTPLISAQFNSISVNADAKSKLKGNVVFVVDDFSTGSNAMETARNMLMSAGAARVVGITVGKYGKGYTSYTPRAGVQLPGPGGICALNESDLMGRGLGVTLDEDASKQF